MAGKFRAQITHLNRLTDDMLDVSRLQSGKFSLHLELVDLAAVIEEAIDQAYLVNPAIQIRFESPAPESALIVRADRVRMVQVMNNLLNNALKYAPQKDNPRSKTVDIRLTRRTGEPEMAVIEVQDYGPGIPAESLPLIFDRFYQITPNRPRTKSGMGLGLFICKGIIEQMGGRIDVNSMPGEGATFSIRLPLIDGALASINGDESKNS